MSPATPLKRKFGETDITPDKMPYKAGKIIEATEAEEVFNKLDLEYLNSAGKFMSKLLSSSQLGLSKTVPKDLVKEMLISGALDKDMNLTEDSGTKISLKDALLTLKKSEEQIDQPSHIQVINPVQAEEMDPGKESLKSMCEKFSKYMTLDGKFKTEVIDANKSNATRISINEVSLMRKQFEDELFKAYVTKTNMTGVNSKNGWDLAQNAKNVIKKKLTEIHKAEASKKLSDCTMEDLAASQFLRMARILDSCKVDAMAREAKMDTLVGYKTVSLCLTFGTIEDKNAFKDTARTLELNAKDSFPKQYAKQKDRALSYFKTNILLNNKGTWAKADTRVGRIEDPLYITIQTKKASSTDRWENKAKILLLPGSAYGRLTEEQKDSHVLQGID